MDKKIYIDSASTTYVNREVLVEMMPLFNSIYGNENSLHSYGREALALLDTARDKIAKGINALPCEIHFTSGGTEANICALMGLARANIKNGKHIITSKIEHCSVLNACAQLEKEGFEVTYIDCDEKGLVSLSKLMSSIRKDTSLISILVSDNEVGTIQNLNAIAHTAKEKNILFHCDASNAIGAINLDVKTIPIDAMSMSSHKIYGPKGIGALFIKENVLYDSFLISEGQQNYDKCGTINIPSAVGFGKAMELATRDIIINAKKLRWLCDYFVKSICEKIEDVTLNGHKYQRLPNFANLCFERVDNESMLQLLDENGIAASISNNFVEGKINSNYVLSAMDKTPEQIKSSIRFSISKNLTRDDIDYVVEKLVLIVKNLREISPLRKAKEGK